MHLVVARNAPPVGSEHHRCGAHALGIGNRDGQRAADEPDAALARDARQERLLHTVTVDFARGDLVGCLRAEDAEILGQRDQPRALARSLDDQRLDRAQVGIDVAARNRLHRR